MVILISGTTHTGKTALSQRLMEKYKIPYFSIDHLKMGLIRSGKTSLTVNDDKGLTPYLWSIVKEMIKTAIENKQNIIIEGCYIPFDWQKDFDESYLQEINFFCLIMTTEYIENNFSEILKFESIIEKRITTDINKADLIADNKTNLKLCKEYDLEYILIDKNYKIEIEL
ncbi:adenylate kinase [Pumilibacter muris]|uniref:adenylate kinase n=1 Tax=Pumilibacter muris TaxID=2941510 RepID=UPI00203D8A31|nr:adenylate kinase [Pumilibacter muris]